MSDTTTRDIRIQVTSEYLPERSAPAESSYFFAYHVRIENLGEETVQLLSRVWIITDSDGDTKRVEGPGVVGETPVLAPGGEFRYTSYCPLRTTVGTMEGTYRMAVLPLGEEFDAEISPFTLSIPHAVN